MRRALRIGATLWAVQPLLIVVELGVALAAASAAVPLSTLLVDRSISDLGADRQNWVVLGGPEPVQSPAWVTMDAAFVVFGLLMAAGAVMLRSRLPRGLPATVVTALWVVVGLSAAGAGLVPLHVDQQAHVALSAPALLLQPVATVLLATVLPGRWRWATMVVGVLSVVGAVGYLGRTSTAVGSGAFERLALWPAYLWLPVVALVLVAGTRQPGPREADRAVR
ncbi:DUF998 domain-containing protein [Nakamurella deserti]|uniref:DUF998 domain-containing protein n=1 Tax=Nakamurella deserti TaxID=2164074 RepID=UPI0013003DBC|nr:DUF998 domain-containing protein [Nakamurella deserti]